jgi:hypothetical protein
VLSFLVTPPAPRATVAVAGCALVAYAAHHGFGIGPRLDGVFSAAVYGPLTASAPGCRRLHDRVQRRRRGHRGVRHVSKPFDEAQLLDALELAVISPPAGG